MDIVPEQNPSPPRQDTKIIDPYIAAESDDLRIIDRNLSTDAHVSAYRLETDITKFLLCIKWSLHYSSPIVSQMVVISPALNVLYNGRQTIRRATDSATGSVVCLNRLMECKEG